MHRCAQVNVAIMLAPVAFLGHITSQPVEAMARMETDKVSLQYSLLYKQFCWINSHTKRPAALALRLSSVLIAVQCIQGWLT